MGIFLAIIGALGIIILTLVLLLYGWGVYWSLRHWPASIALRKERVQELYEQDAGFQNIFFVVKCILWLFLWPFPLWRWIKRAIAQRTTLSSLRNKNPGATVTCTRQGYKVTYVIETTRLINSKEELSDYLLGKEDFIRDEE